MKFTFAHNNLNVTDLTASLTFYQKALDLTECNRFSAPDGSFILAFLSDGQTAHKLELTWIADRKTPYNLGDNEFHLAFAVDNFADSHARHSEMGCICYENLEMGIYFISDPDGYWLEIIPASE